MLNHDRPHSPNNAPTPDPHRGLGSRSRGRSQAGAGILAVAALALVGCAATGPSPEQLKAMEGSQSSLCVESPGWQGSLVKVHYASFGGKSVGTAGGGGKATCGGSEAVFTNDGRAPAKPASAP